MDFNTENLSFYTEYLFSKVDALQPFPDAEFSVSYSSAEPGCGQTVTTLDNVASINYNCLNADLDAFSVTLVDGPDCSSSAINIVPLPSCTYAL